MRHPLAVVIEDNRMQADIMSIVLRMEGYAVRKIADGSAALEHLAQVTPALIVLDVHLPKVSGDKILAWIRQNPDLQETKVIVVTADLMAVRQFTPRTTALLLKPFSVDQFQELIVRYKPAR